MAVFKLSPEQVSAEIAEMPLLSMPGQAVQERQDYVRSLAEQANGLPGGHVKKIVWDEADGYPRHAWGYVQYTVRPYVPGYGCDGTTDRNIHLIAKRLCAEVGVDYREAYRAAYGKEEPESDNPVWIDRLDDDAALASETIVPEVSRDSLVVMLRDLYQVNNRSLVAELAEPRSGATCGTGGASRTKRRRGCSRRCCRVATAARRERPQGRRCSERNGDGAMDWREELVEALEQDDSGESAGVTDLVEAIEDLAERYAGLEALHDAVEAFRQAEFDGQRWQGRVGYDRDDVFRDAVHAFARERGLLDESGFPVPVPRGGFGP